LLPKSSTCSIIYYKCYEMAGQEYWIYYVQFR
jgi:hypothetical protein